jgi:hypothetical protein
MTQNADDAGHDDDEAGYDDDHVHNLYVRHRNGTPLAMGERMLLWRRVNLALAARGDGPSTSHTPDFLAEMSTEDLQGLRSQLSAHRRR